MSNLLEQASLVLIPSGYEEDVVYSEIPLDGSGDMTLTRASNGTRVNSAGLVEVCPWNLQTYSEDFTNAKYTANQSSVSANVTTAPNGTTTADKIVENTANDQHFIYFTSQQIAYNETRISIYAKSAGRTKLLMWESAITNAQCLFDLSTGVVTSSSSGNAANLSTTVGQIEDAGNGWYRCSFNYSTSSGGGTIRLQLYTTTTSYTGDGTSGVFIWGLQENIGSTAKPYFPTTDRLNVPRLTYQNGGGGCPSLLLEKQSTNLALYSEQFDNAAWSKTGTTISANATTSPDGTQNADNVTPTSTGFHSLQQTITTTGTISYKIYAKYNGYNIWLQIGASSGSTAFFNLQNGTTSNSATFPATFGTGFTQVSKSITSLGNGWYECNLVATGTSTIITIGIAPDENTASYTANGSSVYLYGAQAESSSYPTSYIPTTSSSATRVADECSKTGISSLIGQTEGVVFFEGTIESIGTTNRRIISLSDGTNANTLVVLNLLGTLDLQFAVVDSSVTQASITASNAFTLNQIFKFAFAYANNDFAFYVNGVQIGVDNSGTVPASLANLVFGRGPLDFLFEGKVNQAALFKTRLTNAELASLTTI